MVVLGDIHSYLFNLFIPCKQKMSNQSLSICFYSLQNISGIYISYNQSLLKIRCGRFSETFSDICDSMLLLRLQGFSCVNSLSSNVFAVACAPIVSANRHGTTLTPGWKCGKWVCSFHFSCQWYVYLGVNHHQTHLQRVLDSSCQIWTWFPVQNSRSTTRFLHQIIIKSRWWVWSPHSNSGK